MGSKVSDPQVLRAIDEQMGHGRLTALSNYENYNKITSSRVVFKLVVHNMGLSFSLVLLIDYSTCFSKNYIKILGILDTLQSSNTHELPFTSRQPAVSCCFCVMEITLYILKSSKVINSLTPIYFARLNIAN